MAKKKVAKKKVAKKKAVKKVAKKKVAKKKAVKKVAKKKVAKKPKTCFVLMPFKDPFETYYSAIIKPAVKAAALVVKRGDSLFTSTPIMGDVWQMIQDAEVLVAVLTDKNANVFYELGLAHAIGKPVVLISETITDVPFDLQPLRVILYDKNDPVWGDDLKSTLTKALQDTVGDPVEAVPPMFRKKVKSQAPEDSDTSLRLLALERQVDALAGDRSSRERKRGLRVDVGEVDRLTRSDPPVFRDEEEAVSWATYALGVGVTPGTCGRLLGKRLSFEEATKVVALAVPRAAHIFGPRMF